MSKGFTLIELLIIVVIIGILSAVIISEFFGTEYEDVTECQEY